MWPVCASRVPCGGSLCMCGVVGVVGVMSMVLRADAVTLARSDPAFPTCLLLQGPQAVPH